MFLLLVRYLAGVISFGVTFAGAWLYDFTTTDGETKKRKLTPWGKRALPWICLSLTVNVGLTVWTDWATRKREKTDEAKANSQSVQIAEYQRKSEQRQEDAIKLLNLLGNNLDRLGASSRQDVNNTVQSLSTIGDYKSQFPELYSKLTSAKSFDEFTKALGQGEREKVAERISSNPKCANLPIHNDTPDNPLKFGSIVLGKWSEGKGSLPSLSLTVSGEGIQFRLLDVSGLTNLSDGYALEFADGSRSQKLTCSSKVEFSCQADTFTSAQAKTLYRLVQRRLVTRVHTGKGSFDVEAASAKEWTRTFSCIEP